MTTNNAGIRSRRGARGRRSLYMTSENRLSHRARIRRALRFPMDQPHSTDPADVPGVAAASPAPGTLIGTLVHLWPYIWPSDRADLKMRVVWSVVLLLAAKLTTLVVPFTFKWTTDA